MARQSERRSHPDLQVGMLSEQELTTILQMLQKLCLHMGVNVEFLQTEGSVIQQNNGCSQAGQ